MCQAHLIVDPERPTTVKTRIISSDKHVLRVDEESTVQRFQSAVTENVLREFELRCWQPDEPPEVVVLEDYDKGIDDASPHSRRA